MAPRSVPDQVIDALTAIGRAVGEGTTAVVGWLRANVFTDGNVRWTAELLWDAVRSVVGIVRIAPSIRGALALFSDEIVGNAVGWSAGLAGAALVGQLFEAKGLKNLWGLVGRKDKMLVSQETYAWMAGITSFVVGLAVLIVVRHLVRGWTAEFRRLREARGRALQAAPRGGDGGV